MSKLLQELKVGRILLGDGAMGTSLQKLGLAAGESPEEWNVSHADEVRSIIADYIAAGSDIVQTNSFGGTRFKLKSFGLGDRAAELNFQAAKLARQAAGADHFVAASVGPTGVLLEPLGDAKEDDMYDAFKEQIIALTEGGVDAICIETMMAMEEAMLALRAAKENCDLPVIVTFTFEKNTKGQYRTMMGISPEQVAKELPAAGADIVGSNCGSGIENMVEIARLMRAETDCFLMFQANAGMPVLQDGQTVFKETPQDTTGKIGEYLKVGVNIIGGCCGTTPKHIKAMRRQLDRL